MRQKTFENSICIANRVLPINTTNGTKACYVEMLQAIDGQMMAMLSHHSRVLLVRLDVHIFDRPADNDIMTDFIDRIRRWAYGKYEKVDKLGYVWCRELSSDKELHYHIILMFNGDAVTSSHHVLKKARQIAANHPHRGYKRIPYFDKHHTMIQRGESFSYGKAFYWMSYLAKERTKDKKDRADKANNYQTSRIKPKATDENQLQLL